MSNPFTIPQTDIDTMCSQLKLDLDMIPQIDEQTIKMSPEILLSILSHWEHDMLNCQCHFETVSPTTSELADLFRSPPFVSILINNPELKSQIESFFDKMVRYTVWTKITDMSRPAEAHVLSE